MSTFISLASAPFLVATAFLTVLGIYGIRTDEAIGDIAGTMLLVAAAGSLWLGCVLRACREPSTNSTTFEWAPRETVTNRQLALGASSG